MAQKYFAHIGIPLGWYGVIWAILNLSVGIFSLLAHRIEVWLGRKRSLILMVVLPVFGYIILSQIDSLIGIVFIFTFYLARGFGLIILNDAVNQIIPSTIRATILSIQGLSYRLIFTFAGPLVGWMMDLYPLTYVFLWMGIIFGMIFFTLLWILFSEVSLT